VTKQLRGKRIAILVDNGFEQVEMTEPRRALEAAGAETELISPQDHVVRARQHTGLGDRFAVDIFLEKAKPHEYDGLLLPGGVANPDHLRSNAEAVEFVRAFVDAGKPIAAICHGPRTLIETGMVKGRTMTDWFDAEVVVDRGLVTSRKPADIPAFNQTMIEQFSGENYGLSRTAMDIDISMIRALNH
jgi:protease I